MRSTRHVTRALLTLVGTTLLMLGAATPGALAGPAPLAPDQEVVVDPPPADETFWDWSTLSIGLTCLVLVAIMSLVVARIVTSHRAGGRSPAAV
jgi:hypothetical protein